MLKSVIINQVECVIQSYLQDEYCYLVPQNSNIDGIRIEFWQANKRDLFTTNGKMTKEWKEFINKIDVQKLKFELNIIFGYSPF